MYIQDLSQKIFICVYNTCIRRKMETQERMIPNLHLKGSSEIDAAGLNRTHELQLSYLCSPRKDTPKRFDSSFI